MILSDFGFIFLYVAAFGFSDYFVKLYKLKGNPKDFRNAQEIEDRGFFIGLHTDLISNKDLVFLINNLLNIK